MDSGIEKNIHYVQRKDIDPHRWDACISGSANGLIYARSFYLDQMAKNWDALIWNDYEAVMPLTWNRKYGIRYLYQPPFTAQLGIFSKNPTDQTLINVFIRVCKKYFRFCELQLNNSNLLPVLQERTNYTLDLGLSYEQIRKSYKKNLRQNLKDAATHSLIYKPGTAYPETIDLYKTSYGKRFPHVDQKDYQRFQQLCAEMRQREMLLGRQVNDSSSGRLLSAAIFFKDNRRIYNIMPVTLQQGREMNANHFLLDQLIREFAGQKIILDFEGSEISGVAEFYRKFGSIREPYPFLRFNRLPFPLHYFKNA